MLTKTAADIMIPLEKYPHLTYWFTIRQALLEMDRAIIENNGRISLPRGLLVFDEAYKLLGIVRRRDILRAFKISLAEQASRKRSEKGTRVIDFEQRVNELRRQAEQPISDVMRPLSVMVDHDEDILRIITLMDEHNLSLIPVRKDGRVVGVVRSVDVFHEIVVMVV